MVIGLSAVLTPLALAQLGEMPPFASGGPPHLTIAQRNFVQYKTSGLLNAPNVRARLYAEDLGKLQVCSLEDAIHSGDAFEPLGYGEAFGFAVARGQLLSGRLGGTGCGGLALYNVFMFSREALDVWKRRFEQPLYQELLSKRGFAVDLSVEVLEYHPRGLILELRVKLVVYNKSFRKIRQSTGLLSTDLRTGAAVYLE